MFWTRIQIGNSEMKNFSSNFQSIKEGNVDVAHFRKNYFVDCTHIFISLHDSLSNSTINLTSTKSGDITSCCRKSHDICDGQPSLLYFTPVANAFCPHEARLDAVGANATPHQVKVLP